MSQAAHRREIGTRNGTRALTCWKQAVFVLAWFRDRPDIRRLGQGSGISQATAYRYKDEGIEVLAAEPPTLHEALEKAVEQGLPYLILDGTLISSDRCADKKTSKKGRKSTNGTPARPIIPPGTLCLPKILSAQVGVAIWFRRGPDELVARRQSARCSMMDGCAAATGLPGCDERVRVTAASCRERPG